MAVHEAGSGAGEVSAAIPVLQVQDGRWDDRTALCAKRHLGTTSHDCDVAVNTSRLNHANAVDVANAAGGAAATVAYCSGGGCDLAGGRTT